MEASRESGRTAAERADSVYFISNRRPDELVPRRHLAPAEPISPAHVAATETPIARNEPAMPAAASAASGPASAPLRIDDQVIRRAVAGTDGAVRKLARSVGAELDSERQTPTAQLGSAISDGAVPDCLGPHEYGSLPSAPIFAVQALRGKCK
jgi:hypothetical protein